MAKMSTEERHQKQKEKLVGQSEENRPQVKKSAKDIALDELEALGYKHTISQGVPMFHVKTKADVKTIRDKLKNIGSFGMTYSPVGELANGITEEDDE